MFEKYMKLEDDYNKLLDIYEMDKPLKMKTTSLGRPPIRRDSRPDYMEKGKNVVGRIDRSISFNGISSPSKFPPDTPSDRQLNIYTETIQRTRSLSSYHPVNHINNNSNNIKKQSSILLLCDILGDEGEESDEEITSH
eukprot:jgi/Orpsp1_1/1182197/evm.model.c7180000080299.1